MGLRSPRKSLWRVTVYCWISCDFEVNNASSRCWGKFQLYTLIKCDLNFNILVPNSRFSPDVLDTKEYLH